MRRLLVCLSLAFSAAACAAESDVLVRDSRARWEQSAHGETLRRILPPNVEPRQLPEPATRGARLTVRYCVQCHNLASPAMHHAEKWPAVVARMLPRMQGQGNMGPLLRDMMAGMETPNAEEQKIIVAYLQRHAQKRVEADALPEAGRSHAWASYTQACAQCHALPDPARHTRHEWPQVVARMERNMQWMNRVVGSRSDPREPQYRVEEIVEYLRRYARR